MPASRWRITALDVRRADDGLAACMASLARRLLDLGWSVEDDGHQGRITPADIGIVVAQRAERRHYNGVRPHASLGFRPPAPEVVLPTFAAWPAALRRPASPTMQTVAPRPTLN